MNRVAILPARGGSVRIPGKNIRDFMGQPMISYPIRAARASGLFDRILVSTDDDLIDSVARACQAEVIWRLPDDGSKGTQEIAREVLGEMPEVRSACVIYPCSPFLSASELKLGRVALELPGRRYSMSVKADPLSDAGCFYWGWRSSFRNREPLIGPHTAMVPLERAIDINTPEDWAEAERMYEEST